MHKTHKIIILILLIFTFVLTNVNFNKGNIVPKMNIEQKVPLVINGYGGINEEVPEKLYKMISPEEIILRRYKKGDKEINLAVVVSEDKEDLHAPEVCYKLQGFQFKEEENIFISTGCEISKVNTIKENKPYIFHFYYPDMEKVFKSRSDFWFSYMMDKLLNKPAKKYALILAYTDFSNQEDLTHFSKTVVTYSLRAKD